MQRSPRFRFLWLRGAGGALLFAVAFLPRPAAAVEVVPFASRNQSPFVQIFGLPPAEAGETVPEGHLGTRLVVDLANQFAKDRGGTESIVLDGESLRTTLALRYGLTPRVEVGVDLPFISYSGGVTDGFVAGWHRLLGLGPQNRDDVEDGRLLFEYSRDGEVRFRKTRASRGLGDVLLLAAWRLWPEEEAPGRSAVVRTGLKLPTGSADDLHGSGSVDASVQLAAVDRRTLSSWRLTAFGALGGMALTGGEVLGTRQRHWAAFGTVGLGWSPAEWIAFQVQADGHTAFFRSRLGPLGSPSVQLVMGGSLRLPADVILDLSVSEDVAVETAPDVVFRGSLRRLF